MLFSSGLQKCSVSHWKPACSLKWKLMLSFHSQVSSDWRLTCWARTVVNYQWNHYNSNTSRQDESKRERQGVNKRHEKHISVFFSKPNVFLQVTQTYSIVCIKINSKKLNSWCSATVEHTIWLSFEPCTLWTVTALCEHAMCSPTFPQNTVHVVTTALYEHYFSSIIHSFCVMPASPWH